MKLVYLFANLVVALFVFQYSSAWGTSGTWTITKDENLSEGYNGSIVIMADNITLNCQKNVVMGTGTGNGIIVEERIGVTIKNCVVKNFRAGFRILRSRASFFLDNHSSNNTEEGFDVDNVHETRFIRNVATGNHDGFDLNDSNTNIIQRNNSSMNRANGIELDRSHGNTIELNITNNNGTSANRSGISLDISSGNFIRLNNSNFNKRNGIRLTEDSNNNMLTSNQACQNRGLEDNPDIFVNRSIGNTSVNNTFCKGPMPVIPSPLPPPILRPPGD